MTREPQTFRRSGRSVRLTFSYEGADIRLEARQLIDMRTPSSDPLLDPMDSAQAGFWVELHNRENQPLYRRILHNPMMFAAQLPTGNERASSRATFFVVVPNLPLAETLVLYSSPIGYESTPEAAKPVLRVSLPN